MWVDVIIRTLSLGSVEKLPYHGLQNRRALLFDSLRLISALGLDKFSLIEQSVGVFFQRLILVNSHIGNKFSLDFFYRIFDIWRVGVIRIWLCRAICSKDCCLSRSATDLLSTSGGKILLGLRADSQM